MLTGDELVILDELMEEVEKFELNLTPMERPIMREHSFRPVKGPSIGQLNLVLKVGYCFCFKYLNDVTCRFISVPRPSGSSCHLLS